MEVGELSVPPSAVFRHQVKPWRHFSAEKQLLTLREFRSALEAEASTLPDDLTCLRFLRARGMNTAAGLDLWRNYLDWRRAMRVDYIFGEELAVLNDASVGAALGTRVFGLDFLGRPVNYVDAGKLDMRACRKSGITQEMLLTRHTQEMELLLRSLTLRDPSTEAMRRCWTGKMPTAYASDPLLGHLAIVDIGKCTIGAFWSSTSVWIAKSKMDQDYYPELLGCAVLINPVFGFETAWKFFQKVLDKHTLSKLEVIAGDPRQRLSQLVPQDSLPTKYRLCNKVYDPAADLYFPDVSLHNDGRSADINTREFSKLNVSLMSIFSCCTLREEKSEVFLDPIDFASAKPVTTGRELGDVSEPKPRAWLVEWPSLCRCSKRKRVD